MTNRKQDPMGFDSIIEHILKESDKKRKDVSMENNHMTLGNLIDAMYAVVDKSLPVTVNGNLYPQDPHSYRGYYSDLSFETYSDEPVTVQVFLDILEDSVGDTFTGWKGGDFTMGSHTLVWFSPEGSCSGEFPVNVVIEDEKVIIKTDFEKW